MVFQLSIANPKSKNKNFKTQNRMKTIVRNPRNSFNAFPIMFDEIFQDWAQGSVEKPSTVAVNVEETKDAFLLEVVAPGFKKEEFSIHLENDLLTISHQKNEEETVEKRNYTRKEHHFQSFKRSFTLPKNTIEADAIHAIYESGVLNITLPKKEAVKPQPAKVIEIK